MITAEQLEQLEAFDGRGAHVLSAYLDLDPARQVRQSYRAAFEDLVKGRASASTSQRAAISCANPAGSGCCWRPSSRSGRDWRRFPCASRELWQAHVLSVRVHDHLAFEPRADVAPLLELLDEYERYAVALVDKEKARLFTVFLGEIEESLAFEEVVPGRHDQGGLSQTHYQRHHELHVHWHLKRVAQGLAELLRRRRFDRLILAGPEEATSELRRLLPRALAHRLVAVIPAKVFAGQREILETTLEIERQVEREVEERLLAQLLDAAGPGGRATVGVTATLDALWGDVVQTLVLADRVHKVGSECPNCARLEPGRVTSCPACGKGMRPLHDLFHRAMERAREQAASVEVLHGAAARRLQELGDGLAALLRYSWPASTQPTAVGRSSTISGPPDTPSDRH